MNSFCSKPPFAYISMRCVDVHTGRVMRGLVCIGLLLVLLQLGKIETSNVSGNYLKQLEEYGIRFRLPAQIPNEARADPKMPVSVMPNITKEEAELITRVMRLSSEELSNKEVCDTFVLLSKWDTGERGPQRMFQLLGERISKGFQPPYEVTKADWWKSFCQSASYVPNRLEAGNGSNERPSRNPSKQSDSNPGATSSAHLNSGHDSSSDGSESPTHSSVSDGNNESNSFVSLHSGQDQIPGKPSRHKKISSNMLRALGFDLPTNGALGSEQLQQLKTGIEQRLRLLKTQVNELNEQEIAAAKSGIKRLTIDSKSLGEKSAELIKDSKSFQSIVFDDIWITKDNFAVVKSLLHSEITHLTFINSHFKLKKPCDFAQLHSKISTVANSSNQQGKSLHDTDTQQLSMDKISTNATTPPSERDSFGSTAIDFGFSLLTRLRNITFKNCHFDDMLIRLIRSINPELRVFELIDYHGDVDILSELFGVVVDWKELEHLDLSNTQLQNEHLNYSFELLFGLPKLKALILSHNTIGKRVCNLIGTLSTTCPIETLAMINCNINSKATKTLFQKLPTTMPNAKIIDLRSNEVSRKYLILIFEALTWIPNLQHCGLGISSKNIDCVTNFIKNYPNIRFEWTLSKPKSKPRYSVKLPRRKSVIPTPEKEMSISLPLNRD